MPAFEAPALPAGIDAALWPRISEHVARAERVSQAIRDEGFEPALARFRGSGHAVEQATLIAAAVQIERLEFDLVVELLRCKIDEFVAYGAFLDLLQQFGKSPRALIAYENFCTSCRHTESDLASWGDRVSAVRDGLASFYVSCGHHDEGHRRFLERHQEDPTSVLVALAASRSFWVAGATNLAIHWLGLGAERARALGRTELAVRLRKKQAILRARQS